MLQIWRTDSYCGTVIHVIDKNIQAAPRVRVRHSALLDDIEYRRVFLERPKATNPPRCFRNVWDSQFLWHRLVGKRVPRNVAQLADCFLSGKLQAGRENQCAQDRMQLVHAMNLRLRDHTAKRYLRV